MDLVESSSSSAGGAVSTAVGRSTSAETHPFGGVGVEERQSSVGAAASDRATGRWSASSIASKAGEKRHEEEVSGSRAQRRGSSAKKRRSVSSTRSSQRSAGSRATVVYLHGNASSRVEGLAQLSLSLALGPGVRFVALDCCGSGHSEGEFVSLGLKEQEDVVAVLDAERKRRPLGRVALWGRSMGAVTALLVASTRLPEASAIVLDSAYASLKDLSLDVARRGAANLPSFLAKSALRWIRDSVSRRADFDIFDVDAAKHAPECVANAFFICAADDTFVEPKHTSTLHDLIASTKKELCICPGTHNSTRPKDAFDRIQTFLTDSLHLDDDENDDDENDDDGPAAASLRGNETLFASALDADLAPLLPESRRNDRPNFAALPPWTIENLIGAKKRADDFDDLPPAPRWLDDDDDEHRVDKVDEMQASTFAAAEHLAGAAANAKTTTTTVNASA
mmetsp:Transcript_17756/g.57461  ORF Transcript_17756/g.57461 Transcript_17756/m.57461 type:complete len:452 (+) Transcript_17756:1528-2883(+)